MPRPAPLLVAALLVFAAATAGMLARVEPFATWYYPLAWYPTLLAGDAVIRLRTGSYRLISRPRLAAALLLWSIPFWLLFEVVNLRMANWYYVFLPADPVARWSGIVLSFATVLPAIFLASELADAFDVARGLPGPSLPGDRTVTWVLQGTGLAMTLLALAWPAIFFPLIWGALTLLVDPWVFRREHVSGGGRPRSLLGHVRSGRWGVPARLVVGGLAIGFLWELFNVAARGKWIYTVPGLEELKLFEMPLLGFLGFPVLALDGYAAWQALATAGLAPAWTHRTSPSPRSSTAPGPALGRAGRLAAAVAAAFSLAALLGMEGRTITSTTPRAADVAGPWAEVLGRAGVDVFDLAHAAPADLSRLTGVDTTLTRSWTRLAGLATLRGIGVDRARALRAAGIGSVGELAHARPSEVARLVGVTGPRMPPRVREARARVWIRAARTPGAERSTEGPHP